MMVRLAPLLIVPFIAACITPLPADAPEFAQRAAPKEGQNEIELLAGFNGRLAIKDDCLGAISVYGRRDSFVTIVWPANAKLERADRSWQVVNEANGQVIKVGEKISGGGGYAGDFNNAALKEYNDYLARDLSAKCAQYGSFSLNRDFTAE